MHITQITIRMGYCTPSVEVSCAPDIWRPEEKGCVLVIPTEEIEKLKQAALALQAASYVRDLQPLPAR